MRYVCCVPALIQQILPKRWSAEGKCSDVPDPKSGSGRISILKKDPAGSGLV